MDQKNSSISKNSLFSICILKEKLVPNKLIKLQYIELDTTSKLLFPVVSDEVIKIKVIPIRKDVERFRNGDISLFSIIEVELIQMPGLDYFIIDVKQSLETSLFYVFGTPKLEVEFKDYQLIDLEEEIISKDSSRESIISIHLDSQESSIELSKEMDRIIENINKSNISQNYTPIIDIANTPFWECAGICSFKQELQISQRGTSYFTCQMKDETDELTLVFYSLEALRFSQIIALNKAYKFSGLIYNPKSKLLDAYLLATPRTSISPIIPSNQKTSVSPILSPKSSISEFWCRCNVRAAKGSIVEQICCECQGEVTNVDGQIYKCERCDVEMIEPVYRSKANLICEDHSSSIEAELCTEDVEVISKIFLLTLKEIYFKENLLKSGIMSYEDFIQDVFGKEVIPNMMIKIKGIRAGSELKYSIVSIADNEELNMASNSSLLENLNKINSSFN